MTSRAQSTLLTTAWRLPSPSRRAMWLSGGTPQLHPARRRRVARGEHPVADGEHACRASSSWRASRGSRRAGCSRSPSWSCTVSRCTEATRSSSRRARCPRPGRGRSRRAPARGRCAAAERNRKVEACGIRSVGCGRAGAVANAPAGDCRDAARARCAGRAAPDSNDFGETGREGRCGATRGSGGRRHGGESRVRHGLGHEALLCWPVEGRGALRFGGRPAVSPARGRSLQRRAPRRQRQSAASSRFPPQYDAPVLKPRADRPHIGSKVIRAPYDRPALHSSRLTWRKNEVVRHRPRSRPGRGHLGARRRLRPPHRRRRFRRHAAQPAAAGHARSRRKPAAPAAQPAGPTAAAAAAPAAAAQALLARPDRRPRRRPRHRRADEPPRPRRRASATS